MGHELSKLPDDTGENMQGNKERSTSKMLTSRLGQIDLIGRFRGHLIDLR